MVQPGVRLCNILSSFANGSSLLLFSVPSILELEGADGNFGVFFIQIPVGDKNSDVYSRLWNRRTPLYKRTPGPLLPS